jgi:hypothetical protein
MTYLRDGWEHLTDDEAAVYAAIRELARQRRTGNNSQIAAYTRLSRTLVGQLTTGLRQRGFIRNEGKGAAYHWRVTAQPVPYSTEARRRDRELRDRQRAMNAQTTTT